MQTTPNHKLHVAIIMDGNGRWAEARGLPRPAGHQVGADTVRAIVRSAIEHPGEMARFRPGRVRHRAGRVRRTGAQLWRSG